MMASYYSQNPEERPSIYADILADNEQWEYADYLHDTRETSLIDDECTDSFEYDYQAYLLQLADKSTHTDEELIAIISGEYHGD